VARIDAHISLELLKYQRRMLLARDVLRGRVKEFVSKSD
jgi:hypothetical protein